MKTPSALLLSLCLGWVACAKPPEAHEVELRDPESARPAHANDAKSGRDASAAPRPLACPPRYGSTAACTPAEPRSITRWERTDVGHGPGAAEEVATLEWPRCNYPEGTCRCEQGPRVCAGGEAVVPRPASEPPVPFTWQCTAALRADGCPGAEPRTGEACSVTHSCGYCTTRFECENGRWSVPIIGPPPP
jgi:hypothetical protein